MVASGLGLLVALLLGVAIAYGLSFPAGNLFQLSPPSLVAALAVGVLWSICLLNAIDILHQGLALKGADPVPGVLDLSRPEAVQDHLGKLDAGNQVSARAGQLLAALAAGAAAPHVIGLAGLQAQQARQLLRATGAVGLFLLVVIIWGGEKTVWSLAGLLVFALILYARHNVLNRIDLRLSASLLSRLPNNLPGTGVTAGELGKLLGDAIRQAFKEYVPQPEQLAKAVENSASHLEKGLDKSAARLQEALNKHVEQLNSTMGSLSDRLQTATQGLAARVDEKLVDVIAQLMENSRGGAQALQTALTQHAQQVGSASDNWSRQVGELLAKHADAVGTATQQLAGQLGKIMELEQDIQKVLHVQEAVDGTLKSVATAQEFKDTLSTLRRHIEESDKLIRDATRPRKIRLVESDTDAPRRAS
jgi:hypothetical protein